MMEYTVTFPYEIGTHLFKEENGIIHEDEVSRYVVRRSGIFVIVWLNVNEMDARLSVEIPLDEFMKTYYLDKSELENKRVRN